ncbi:MAG: metallophosphoesterase family protein, partial [Desulforhopalus sp.]
MTIRLLLISDIHGNYPALQAIDRQLNAANFDYIINSGDCLVYAPFPNETLDWLSKHKAISILGNTDQKVIKLLLGKSFKKPT